MIVVLGGFGRTGSVVASHCRKASRVRLVTRDPHRLADDAQGEVAVARLTNEGELRRAFAGADAVYAILPDDFAAQAFHAERRAMVDSIANAVRHEGVPRVALMSSSAATLGEHAANGLGSDLAYFERAMQDTPACLTILRAPYFLENVLQALPFAERDGVYPCFLASSDTRITTMAVADVGAIAARALMEPPGARREIVDLVGPEYSTQQLATRVGHMLGRKLAVIHIPPAQQEETLRQFMSAEAARAMVETTQCLGSGSITLHGDRQERGETQLEQVLRAARLQLSSTDAEAAR